MRALSFTTRLCIGHVEKLQALAAAKKTLPGEK
jgi:hypothetical protein